MTTTTNSTNLEEFTDTQLRQKCLTYGLQNIPITKETRQKVIEKLRICISKHEEKKLALRNRLNSNQKQNARNHSIEKPAVEKCNITTKQFDSARIVAASVLQELRKKEKKVTKQRAPGRGFNPIKQNESQSNASKSTTPIKVIRKRPSLSGVFGAVKSKENLALKSKSSIIIRSTEGTNNDDKNQILLKLNKSRETLNRSNNIVIKSLEAVSGNLNDTNKKIKNNSNNKSYTIVSDSVKENMDNLDTNLANLKEDLDYHNKNKNENLLAEKEKQETLADSDEKHPKNLNLSSTTEMNLAFNSNDLASAVLFSEKINELEFSCKEDSDFDQDCVDCLSSDESPRTERYYSVRCRTFKNIK